MPFVASTSKHPTAVLGVATGFFLGNGENLLIINRLNMISLFKEKDKSLDHLGDFSLFASIKFMEAIPFFNSKGNGRHLVFLFSIKQEVSIISFRYNTDGGIEMVTLFHGGVDSSFYQQRPSEVSLCCSGIYRTLHDDILPLVIFSIHGGSVFIFDVASAIVSYTRNSKNSLILLENIFSRDYLQNVLKKQKRKKSFIHGYFYASELDVRSISLGKTEIELGIIPLYVLYSDSSSKTHVAEYIIDLGRNEDNRNSQKPPSRPWTPDAYDVLPTGNSFRRNRVILPNVETNACLLHVTSEGLFVIGPQLITFVSSKNFNNSSNLLKELITYEFPDFGMYVEPVCCTSLPNRELLILFWDGTCVKAILKEETEGLNSSKMVLVNTLLSSLRTIPDSIAIIGGHCIIGSSKANTLWMKWNTGENGVLVNNCGPVFDITVAADGPRMSVIASTGVGVDGGLSLVRSAVNVRHDILIENFPIVKRVCFAGDIIIFSFPGYSRVCRCLWDEIMNIEEIFESPFDSSEETLTLSYNSELDLYFQVTTVGLNFVNKSNISNYIMREETIGIGHAHTNFGLIIFSSSTIIYIYSTQLPISNLKLQLENEVSCIVIYSSNSFFVGEWNSATVSLYEIYEGVINLKGKFFCSAIPYSICILPHLSKPRLLVGLLNGYIVDLNIEDISKNCSFRETLLMMQPVQLFNLESHNSILCLGEVPLIIIVSDTGFQLTGIDFNDITVCAIIDSPQSLSRYVFFSRSESSLIFGNILDLQKLNTNFLSLKATVTRLKYVAWWNVFILSIRRNEKDQILLMMCNEIAHSVTSKEEQNSFELLENERCVFIEPVILKGSNEWNSNNDTENYKAILIGTTFVFPDEQLSRSSRFMWCSVEQGKVTTEKPQLRLNGNKDVEGALQCCCIVPNYSGRIALGINGCIVIYTWNSGDSTFIAEDTLRVGTIITRLVPIIQQEISCIVAFDARQSCFLIQVDVIQGSLSIVARDPELRGVMDGVVIQSGWNNSMCFGDDFFNFFCISHNNNPYQNSSDNVPNNKIKGRLTTKARYHLGDLVTVMQQGSFAPCSVMNDVVPIPNTLIPGVCGPQIVFGTSHGAFGTITPITNETYFFLKALEVAVSAVIPSLGGFNHATYREIISPGQERGLSRNASFEETNPEATAVLQNRRKRYISKCVCSGDLVETFLTLPQKIQQRVVFDAEFNMKRWCTSIKSSLEEFLEHSDLYHFSTQIDDSPIDEIKTLNKVNNLFGENGLPSLPLKIEAVNAFIQNLQRTH